MVVLGSGFLDWIHSRCLLELVEVKRGCLMGIFIIIEIRGLGLCLASLLGLRTRRTEWEDVPARCASWVLMAYQMIKRFLSCLLKVWVPLATWERTRMDFLAVCSTLESRKIIPLCVMVDWSPLFSFCGLKTVKGLILSFKGIAHLEEWSRDTRWNSLLMFLLPLLISLRVKHLSRRVLQWILSKL